MYNIQLKKNYWYNGNWWGIFPDNIYSIRKVSSKRWMKKTSLEISQNYQFIVNLFIDASNLHSAAIPEECILSREAISCSSVRTMRDHLTKLEATAAIYSRTNSPPSALFNVAKVRRKDSAWFRWWSLRVPGKGRIIFLLREDFFFTQASMGGSIPW